MTNPDQPARPALYAVYDLGRAPMTFDVLHFYALAHVWTERSGFAGYHMIFVLGDGDGFRHMTPKDNALDREQKMWRLRHIHLQHAAIARRCLGISFFERRADLAGLLRAVHPQQMFPPKYTVEKPTHAFMLHQLFGMKPTGTENHVFEPTPAALRNVDEWLANRTDGKPPVVMTLRTSKAEPKRNSQIEEWIAAARHMQQRGFAPVVMCDTDVTLAGLDTRLFEDLPVFGIGGLDVELRLAMYRRAYLNFADNGGPPLLNFFMPDSKLLLFLPVEKLPEVVTQGGLPRMAQLLGVEPYGDFPMATPVCRFVWRPDNRDVIIEEFEKTIALIGEPAAAGTSR